jgi:hypothetical protein
MPAYNACEATVFDVTDGDPGDEVLGLSSVEWGEEAEVSEYTDNTTGCTKAALAGPITRDGQLTVNLQDGAEKGKLPFRAGQTKTLQVHIDQTGNNYWELEVLITAVQDYNHDLNSADPVQATFPFRINTPPVGHGTLAEDSGS